MLVSLRKRGRDAYAIATADEIVSDLAPRLKGGEIVVIMSNGSFDGIHEKLLRVLRGQKQARTQGVKCAPKILLLSHARSVGDNR